MTDPVSSARLAREGLARGLGALQGPGVPESLQAAAEPVAEAMGLLHRVESSGGQATTECAPLALAAARRALGLLQAQGDNPAVMNAMEAVASSLGLIHGLTQARDAAPKAVPITTPMQERPASAPQPPQPPTPAAAQPLERKKAQPPPKAEPIEPMAPTPRADAIPLNTPTSKGREARAEDPLAATAPAASARSALEATARQDRNDLPTEPQGSPPPAPTGPEPALEVEASLGANSDSNFFLGLSGSDVIEHGGVFVATYNAPPLRAELMVRVLLPGGFEFRARGLVAWTRTARTGIPGCGIRFTQIDGEGASLVRRYVRKREPLLHDDL